MIIPKNKVEDFIQEKKHKYFFISGKHEGTTEEVIFLLDDLNSLQAHGVHYVFEKREYYDCLGETCPFCKNGDNWMNVIVGVILGNNNNQLDNLMDLLKK